MGCSISRLDDEEAVKLCKDRMRFMKQAVEQRIHFATRHLAYIQSLKRVSDALRDYVEGDEPREFLLDSFLTPPFNPIKKTSSGYISISPSFNPKKIQFEPKSSFKVNYLRPSGNPAVSVEERPQSPETVQVETYSPMHQYGTDDFFAMQSSPMNSSFFSYSPHRPSIPPPSPQTSQWDLFWNPFSSLEYYGYPMCSSHDHIVMDDEMRGLRQVREEEGIPDLEDETETEKFPREMNVIDERAKIDVNGTKEEVTVEEVTEEDEQDDDDDAHEGTEFQTETEHESCPNAHRKVHIEVSKSQTAGNIETRHQEMTAGEKKAKEETPGFTVYVNRRPTSMAEVVRDLEAQFTLVCDSAKVVSSLLEARKAQYSSSSSELSAMKMLNPVALFRSVSSRSASSRFPITLSHRDDNNDESGTDFSEELCTFSGSHQSTLDRLYVWEKKLYDEVKSGEKVRIAYEKRCKQLRNRDAHGEGPLAMDKTRAAISDLDTQIKVSIHTVEAICKRIETLRDEELHPQLLELVQGLEKMWKVIAECHQSQKRTLDDAKLLLAGTPSKLDAKKRSSMSVTDPEKLARSASNLESEIRNWRVSFELWITSQRSYLHALTGWLLRCMRCEPDTSKLPFSPRRSSNTHPIFGLSIQWSRFLDTIRETPVLEGMDFFAAGMGSIYAQQLREESRRGLYTSRESSGGMEMVEIGEVEEVMTPEKMAEVAVKVLCAGMSVSMSSLTEFAAVSAEGYSEIVKQWENVKWPLASSGTECNVMHA